MLPPEGVGDWAGAAIVAWLFGSLVYQAIANRHPLPNPLASRPALVEMLKGSFPLALTGGACVLGMWYARARTCVRARSIWRIREANGARRVPIPRIATTWRWRAGHQCRWSRFAEYVKTHKRFWLYSFGSTWAEHTLRQSGATLTLWWREAPADGVL